MFDDIFSSAVDSATYSIDGVVNSTVNNAANNVAGTGMGVVDGAVYGTADVVSDMAYGIGGPMVGKAVSGFTGDIASGVSSAISDAIYSSDFMSSLRSFSLFGNDFGAGFVQGSWITSGDVDWRVRLSLPATHGFQSSSILAPLIETDSSMVWPYTPLIVVTNSANYNSLSPTHNNYAYPAYENSSIEQITITGDFAVENPQDAEYWIAVNHYLRSITKMSYGNSSNLGTPPPVVRLNGYGSFVFNNVPVVVENFMMNLPKDVDYIKANVGPNGSWVPTLSEISVTVRVAYSRDSVNQFSLDSFVSGSYLNSGSTGFI